MAKKRVEKFHMAFRLYAVERLKQCENTVALSKELGSTGVITKLEPERDFAGRTCKRTGTCE